MSPRTDTRTRITLDLRLSEDYLSGTARNGAGSGREFSGRLGLMSTIDELLAEAGDPKEEQMTLTTQAVDRETERGVAAALRAELGCVVVAPGDDTWDAARSGFSAGVDQRPAAIAYPASTEEVMDVMDAARRAGLRVAPQRTGHNPAPLGDLSGSLLLKTDLLSGTRIDAAERRACAAAGARWEDIVPAASDLGLAANHGSTPDVSIAGYSLGGGLGWYARKHGLAANHVTAIEVVTADGERHLVDADHEPDLFWALRGGGGNFGVVTKLEFELFPLSEVYAGALFFPIDRAGEALHAWHEWTSSVPDEVTSVGRMVRVPPLPEIPEPLRGNSFAVLEAVCLTNEADGADLVAPLRELDPAMDTFAMVPPAGIAELHMDPRDPMPVASSHSLLGELPSSAIDDLLAAAGPESGCTLPSVELRHTGGALHRSGDGHGALDTLPGSFAMFSVGLAADPDTTRITTEQAGAVRDALAPHEAGQYLNFTEGEADPAAFFGEDAYRRLRATRSMYDPDAVLHANHEIPGADERR